MSRAVEGSGSDAGGAVVRASRSGHGRSSAPAGERGEGSSSGVSGRHADSTPRTLGDVMREPSTTVPEVVVLDSLHEDPVRKNGLDPKEDLWLSTADGRYNSPIIPLHVGEPPYRETFYVHKHVLIKSEYFERALCGEFRESDTQSIDLPEENPAIFHFLVAYLYEGRYEPIRPAASALDPGQDKGKANAAAETGADSESESTSSYESDISVRSRRRRERRRQREERRWERMRRKHPGMHRPNCNCPQCATAAGPPCWSCRAPRVPPPMAGHHPHHQYPPNPYHADPLGRVDRRRPPPRGRGNRGAALPAPPVTPPPPAWTSTDPNGGRITDEEDLRTWLLAYELNLDVYILANKFLLEGFKREIARCAVDMLESAGSDAAVFEVLCLCRKLYDGLPETDPLLKMVFARVGFLQPWRRAPRETDEFLLANPEIAPLLLREMAARREDDVNGRALPSMVRPWYQGGGNGRGGEWDLGYAPPPLPPPPGRAPAYQGVHGGPAPGYGRGRW